MTFGIIFILALLFAIQSCYSLTLPPIIEADMTIISNIILNNDVVIKNEATLKFKGSLILNMKNFTIDAYYGKIIFEGDKNKVITTTGNGWKIKVGGYRVCEFTAKYTKFINGSPGGGNFDNCIFEGQELNINFEHINNCIFNKFKFLELYVYGGRIINNSEFKNISKFISPFTHLKNCKFSDINDIISHHVWSSSFLNVGKVSVGILLTDSIFNNVLNIHSRAGIKKTTIKNCGTPDGIAVRAGSIVSNCIFDNNIGKNILFQGNGIPGKEPGTLNSVFKNNKAYDAMIISGARYFVKNYFIKNKAKYIYKTTIPRMRGEIYGQNNCWGTTNKTWISDMIYDYKKDETLSEVKFTPLLDC